MSFSRTLSRSLSRGLSKELVPGWSGVKLELLSSPVIAADTVAEVGLDLSLTDAGTYNETPESLTYQWQRDGVDIVGATGTSYTLIPLDAEKDITVVETATFGALILETSSNAIEAIPVYENVTPPTISSAAYPALEGETLTLTGGTWGFVPISFDYQWLLDGEEIAGATATTYVVTALDLDLPITCRVRANYSMTYVEVVTNTITPETYVNTVAPVIAADDIPAVDRYLRVTNQGTWTRTPTSIYYQWYAGASSINGATSDSYQLTASEQGVDVYCLITAYCNSSYAENSSNSIQGQGALGDRSLSNVIFNGTEVQVEYTQGVEATIYYYVSTSASLPSDYDLEYGGSASWYGNEWLTVFAGTADQDHSGLSLGSNGLIVAQGATGILYVTADRFTFAAQSLALEFVNSTVPDTPLSATGYSNDTITIQLATDGSGNPLTNGANDAANIVSAINGMSITGVSASEYSAGDMGATGYWTMSGFFNGTVYYFHYGLKNYGGYNLYGQGTVSFT